MFLADREVLWVGRGKRCNGGLDVTEIVSKRRTGVSLKSRSPRRRAGGFCLIRISCGVEVCAYVELKHQQRHGGVNCSLEQQGCGDQIPAFSYEQHHRADAIATSLFLQWQKLSRGSKTVQETQ